LIKKSLLYVQVPIGYNIYTHVLQIKKNPVTFVYTYRYTFTADKKT